MLNKQDYLTMKTDVFALRHIGPREKQRKQMLDAVGVNSIE